MTLPNNLVCSEGSPSSGAEDRMLFRWRTRMWRYLLSQQSA